MKKLFGKLLFIGINPLENYDLVLQKIMEWLLLLIVILGLPVIIMGMVEGFRIGMPATAIWYLVLFSPILIVGLFTRRLPYKLKAWVVIIFLFVLAVQNLSIYAYTGASIPVFMVLYLLTTIYFGARMGLAMIVFSIIAIALVGYLLQTGFIVLQVDIMELLMIPITWISVIVVVFFLGILVVSSYSFIKHNFFQIIDITRQQADELQKANSELKREIRHNAEIQKELQILVEKAQESERLKSAFLANVSHEIRTPMNGILGFTDLLRDPEISAEQQQNYIQIIRKSGNRMLDTINDIIEISKIETGQVEMNTEWVDVVDVVEYHIEFLKPLAEKKKLYIDVQLKKRWPRLMLQTDEHMLSALLMNLINNAIKYTESGGVQIGYEPESDGVRVCVKDTGLGISKEKQKCIFDRFVQAHNNDTGTFEGSGLGLAIVKAYIDLLGGKIWFTSTEGLGSEFNFWLPGLKPDDNHGMD